MHGKACLIPILDVITSRRRLYDVIFAPNARLLLYCGYHFASRWLCLELLCPRELRPYPLPTLTFILRLIIMNPSLIYRCNRKASFDLKCFNKALHTDAVVAICSSLRDLGTQRAVSLRIPKNHVRLLKRYHVKCLMPALFLLPEFAYQSISDPDFFYTFLRRLQPVGVQTLLHLLKTFYRVGIPYPEFNISIIWRTIPIKIG